MTEHRVGIARHAVERSEGRLVAVGLGSCVVICLHDANARVGAMAHVLLPTAAQGSEPEHPARYADTAVPLLLKTMKLHGAEGPYTARLVGGAALFADILTTTGRVGERNVNAARTALAAAHVPIVAEDVGGTAGRSVAFDVESGSIAIRLPNGEAHVL